MWLVTLVCNHDYMHNLTSPLRISIYVVVAVGLGLAAWLAFVLFDEGKPALQGKDELIGSLTPGRIMYIRWEQFQEPRITFCGPDHPERRIGESWWEVGADGLFSGVSVVRGPDGQLLTYMEITSGEVEYTDVATGHRMYYGSPSPSAEGHAGWIESIWDRPASIEEDGYLFKRRSELNGHASLVYEEMWVDERDGGEKIRGMEFVEEQPLLFRSSSYEVGEGGQRTLVSEHRFVEYRVLPEGSIVPTIEVPPPTHPADPEECPDMDMRPTP